MFQSWMLSGLLALNCTAPVELRGAASQPGAAAGFVSTWAPRLSTIAACLQAPAHARACVQVQGQYDAVAFTDATAQAVGGQSVANLYRADGRALSVIAHLSALGVDAQQIQRQPPGLEPTFRGVLLTMVPDCLAPAPASPPWLASPSAIAEALDEIGFMPDVAAVEIDVMPVSSSWWLEAAPVGGGMLADPQPLWGGAMGVGIGAHTHAVYGAVRLRVTTGQFIDQRTGLEYAVAAGWRTDTLRLGVALTHRLSAPEALDPWLEQIWSVGPELSVRAVNITPQWSLGPWLHGAPGLRMRRGQVQRGRIVRLPAADPTLIWRGDIGLAVEYHP